MKASIHVTALIRSDEGPSTQLFHYFYDNESDERLAGLAVRLSPNQVWERCCGGQIIALVPDGSPLHLAVAQAAVQRHRTDGIDLDAPTSMADVIDLDACC
jgi:hypothetical protein